MNQPVPDYAQVCELPVTGERITIANHHLDANGHVNIRWYFEFCAMALQHVFTELDLALESNGRTGCGFFTLGQNLRYLAEVTVGETITTRVAVLDRTDKALNGVTYLVNESQAVVAHTSEFLGLYVELTSRRGTPFSPETNALIEARLGRTARLSWTPEPSGTLSVRRNRRSVET